MRAFPLSPFAVASVVALLLLTGLAPAPAAPAAAPSRQLPPTPTPTPTPRPGGGGGGGGGGPIRPGGTFGEPHLRTPDGFGFQFQAAGEFVLVASTVDDLAVQVRQDPWPGSSVASMNTAVAMTVAGDRVGVNVGTGPHLWVNGQPTTLDGGSLPLPQGGRVEREGAYYTVIWPDQSEVEVGVRDQYLDVIVRLAAARAGQVVGLLGNADGDPNNDLTTRDGTVLSLWETADYRQLYGQFGRSWRISRDESLFDSRRLGGSGPGRPQEEALAYAQPGFPSALMPSALVEASDLPPEVQRQAEAICRQAGVVAADFLADCVLDVGLTGEAEFAASAAAFEAALAPPAGAVGGKYQTNTANPSAAEMLLGANIGDFSVQSFHAEVIIEPPPAPVKGSLAIRIYSAQNEAAAALEYYDMTFTASEDFGTLFEGVAGYLVFDGTWIKRAAFPVSDPRHGMPPEEDRTIIALGFAVDTENDVVVLCDRTLDMPRPELDPLGAKNACMNAPIAVLQPVG